MSLFDIFSSKKKHPHAFPLIIGAYQRENPGKFVSAHSLVATFMPGVRVTTFDSTRDIDIRVNVVPNPLSNMRVALLEMKAGMERAANLRIPEKTRKFHCIREKKVQKLMIYCSQSPLVKQLKGEWGIKDEVIDGYVADVHQLAKKFEHGVEFVFIPSKFNITNESCRASFESNFTK